MKIASVGVVNSSTVDLPHKTQRDKYPEHSQTHINISDAKFYAYQDYNISFGGRTPENFYQQDFNRKNMPDSMNEYLNYDYNSRCHIPPEQMMREVFKYLELADNFEDVKDIYPNERLFSNLHNNKQKNRSSILGEINIAKQLDNAPLLQDGSDDFGLYLLKKIYLEGKTVKEIDKDFYQKDMNDIYRGVITKPIDSQITSAFGIRYPKSPFWNSFIATREEYKKFFVTLPKNSVNPAVNLENTKNTGITNNSKDIDSSQENQILPHTRKYKLKSYHKKQITDAVKDAAGEQKEIEKKIKRRFASEDPHAAFIIKYLSPIMAVAADRVHLSEEIKSFCDFEKNNGKTRDDEFMFKRFWKHNPDLLNYYAQTITDTIDLFEDIYGEGGLIPINKDLEVISSDTENKISVDYVTPEFVELLNYTQTIAPDRDERYKLHDKLQNDWNEHFISRYGIPENPNEKENFDKISPVKIPVSEDKSIDIEEKYKQSISKICEIYPTPYASKYMKYMLNNPDIDNDYKAAYSYFIGDNDGAEFKLSKEEFYDKFYQYESDFVYNNEKDSMIAKLAILEILAQNNYKDYRLYTVNTFDLPFSQFSKKFFIPIIKENKSKLNQLYAEYKKPLKPGEVNKVVDEMYKQLINYKTQDEITEKNTNQILLMLRDAADIPPRVTYIKYILKFAAKKYLTYSKAILSTNESEEEKRAKFENIMLEPIRRMISRDSDITLLSMSGEENFQKYVQNLSEEIKMTLISRITKMRPDELAFFKFKSSEYWKDYEADPEKCEKKYGISFR